MTETPSAQPLAVRPRVLVVLDTNTLFLPFTRRFPLEREIHRLLEGARIEVPQSVLGELDRLSERGRPNARAARAFAGKYPVCPTDLKGDAALETLARDLGAVVVTADGELRRRLYQKGMKVLFPRGEKHLAFVQGPGPQRRPRPSPPESLRRRGRTRRGSPSPTRTLRAAAPPSQAKHRSSAA